MEKIRNLIKAPIIVIIGLGASVLIGFVAGMLSGLLGIGGGSVLVPAMVFLLGMSQHRAHGTSLLAISFIAFFSVLYYADNHQVNWTIAIELALGGVIGANIGARIANAICAKKLKLYFGIFLAIVGLRMLWDARGLLDISTSMPAIEMLAISGFAEVLFIFLVGIVAGILSGLLGVGGATVMVPIMVLILGYQQTLAQGISLAVIVPVSVSGTIIHSRHGNVIWSVGIWLALGGIIGGLIGSKIAISVNPLWLTGGFGILMLIMGALMVFRKPVRDSQE